MTDDEPETSSDAALRWVRLVVVDIDIEAAWPLMTSNLRLATVQDLIWENRHQAFLARVDLEDLAAELSRTHPTHPQWSAMKEALSRLFSSQFADVPARLDRLWPLDPRIIDATHELVVFTDLPPGETMPPPGAEFFALPFLMESTADVGWLVAGFWDEAPTPGWPPRLPSVRGQVQGPLRLS